MTAPPELTGRLRSDRPVGLSGTHLSTPPWSTSSIRSSGTTPSSGPCLHETLPIGKISPNTAVSTKTMAIPPTSALTSKTRSRPSSARAVSADSQTPVPHSDKELTIPGTIADAHHPAIKPHQTKATIAPHHSLGLRAIPPHQSAKLESFQEALLAGGHPAPPRRQNSEKSDKAQTNQ